MKTLLSAPLETSPLELHHHPEASRPYQVYDGERWFAFKTLEAVCVAYPCFKVTAPVPEPLAVLPTPGDVTPDSEEKEVDDAE